MVNFLKKAFGSKKKEKKTAAKTKSTNNNAPEKASVTDASTTVSREENSKKSVVSSSNRIEVAETPPKTEREQLIENALAIHKEKSKILDNLPPAVRTKLTAMAMALYIKQKSDHKKH